MKNSGKEMKDQVKNHKEWSKEISMSRRKFLRKAGYAAPSFIVLGNLPKPLMAGGSDTKDTGFGGYGGGPGGFGG